MTINASIVDQQVSGLLEKHDDWLPAGEDQPKKKSAAFTILCMGTCLDLPLEAAAELLTDGGQDAGVDGLHVGEVDDDEFTVTIFQAKYKWKDLEGAAHFPENGVEKSINTVSILFDPSKDVALNERLKPKVENVRSLVRDGYIPNVHVVLCSNGQKWNEEAQRRIDQSGIPKDQARWTHLNHDTIVNLRKKTKPVSDTLRFSGAAIVENFNFRRVLVGKVPVTEIAELFNRHNDLLLQRNIRRYLGLNANRVNTQIRSTLADAEGRKDFYFFNNGVTIICNAFRHNALQGENYQVKLDNLQVINGGQTCKTIQQTLSDPELFDQFADTYVMVRVYELEEDDDDRFVRDITFATNSQNPVDLRDLRSNDPIQKQLEIALKGLGVTYRRQREEGAVKSDSVTSITVAVAVLAVWRRKPHQAKFHGRRLFGVYYDAIFDDLNAAQAWMATLIFRAVENRRKRPADDVQPEFLPYASHFLAMLIGEMLLEDAGLELTELNHRTLPQVQSLLEANTNAYHLRAIVQVEGALKALYGGASVSLQQLAATFRRGDLLDALRA